MVGGRTMNLFALQAGKNARPDRTFGIVSDDDIVAWL
jgi:hypothetical protein